MNRLLGVLALAVLATAGCRAYGPDGFSPYCGGPACGERVDGCDDSCGEGGCCDSCQTGIWDAATADCPLCHTGDCGLFRRNCGCGEVCGCGPYGGGEYDYSACQACGPSYSPCCGPTPNGVHGTLPACASGDHVYNFAPGPPVGQTAYPYYTTRGPRDFLNPNPASIGPY